MIVAILGISLLVQLTAVGFALDLSRLTEKKAPWLFIAGAIIVMSGRSALGLYQFAAGSVGQSVDLASALLELVIALLLLFGVIFIRAYLSSPKLSSPKNTESGLADGEEVYRGIFDNMAETYYRTDNEGRLTMASPSAVVLLGYSLEELIGMKLADLYTYPSEREAFLKQLDVDQASARGFEAWLTRKDGSRVIVETNSHFIVDGDGNVLGVEGIARDATDRKRAEQLSTRLGHIVEDSVNEIYVFDSASLNFILVNRGARLNLGYTMEELRKLTPIDIKPQYTAEEFADLVGPLRDGTAEVIQFDSAHRRKDGSTYPVDVRLQLAPSEDPPVFFAIIEDVSERKRTEEDLVQAQKMEAVGQLTGGIAHDFNNLLMVMLGNLELVQNEPGHSDEVTEFIKASVDAGLKGAALTQRLLAFSRRQSLQPETIDLRVLITGMDELLRRTLREDIDIEVVADGQLWLCEVDPTQLENVLLNLTINARDAMPDGGTLTIETSNVYLDDQFAASHMQVVPGDYVQMAVSDTGLGMSPDTKVHAFDPFFTTKEAGQGSGLGLSTAYGFVLQSGGGIDIHSEPDEGTTIRIYLPRARTMLDSDSSYETDNEEPSGHGEVVLVVEDDQQVGDVAVRMLRKLGYVPLHAADATTAIEILEKPARVDLLLTDIILSGSVNGAVLAEQVGHRWPEVRVLYMSGYTEGAVMRDGRLDPAADLLQKPFSKTQLAQRVRQALQKTLD